MGSIDGGLGLAEYHGTDGGHKGHQNDDPAPLPQDAGIVFEIQTPLLTLKLESHSPYSGPILSQQTHQGKTIAPVKARHNLGTSPSKHQTAWMTAQGALGRRQGGQRQLALPGISPRTGIPKASNSLASRTASSR